MIEGDVLVPGPFENVLQSWQFEALLLNAFIISALATVLSYQTASIAFDILLGLKRKNVTKASDFHAAMLTDEGSPLSVWAAMLRTDWLDRARFPRKIPHGTRIARHPHLVKNRIIIKLLVLLITAPLFNLFAVIITLERDQEITFAGAKFGGLAVGVNDDLSDIKEVSITSTCFEVPFEAADHQQSQVFFFSCMEQDMRDNEGSWISVGLAPGESVKINMVVSGILYETAVHYGMIVGQEVFRIRRRTTEGMLRRLLDHGDEVLSQFCITEGANSSGVSLREGEDGLVVSKNVSCTDIKRDPANIVMLAIIDKVTLVESDVLEIVRASDLDSDNNNRYLRADDYILLEQRTSYVGMGTLFVITGCAVLVRIIVKIVAQNDVHDGIHILIRSCFGVGLEDSLLRWNEKVRYDHKHQDGNTAHFGVKTNTLPEVEEFVGGIVGVSDDRPVVFVEKCVAPEEVPNDVTQLKERGLELGSSSE